MPVSSCPTFTEVSDENCNQCILNANCNTINCKDACFDNSNCKYDNNYQVTSDFDLPSQRTSTRQVNIGENHFNTLSDFSGLERVCNIKETPNFSVQVNTTPSNPQGFETLQGGDTLGYTIIDNSINFSSDEITFNEENELTDNSPAIPPSSQLKVGYDIATLDNFENYQKIVDLYRDHIITFKNFIDTQDKIDMNNNVVNVDFHGLLSASTLDDMANGIFRSLLNVYDNISLDLLSRENDVSLGSRELQNIRAKIDENRIKINDLKNLNSTAKREIEINLNKSRKIQHTNKVLMIVMIIIGIMVIFPILKATGVLSIETAIAPWCILLLSILAYMAYSLYYTEINRDALEFNKYNFANPTDEEIAKSRALAQMSDKDKARCQAFSELEDELDIPNIDLDVSRYRSRTLPAGDTCSAFQ